MTDSEHEVAPREHVDLTELYRLSLVDVVGMFEHHEESLSVALYLGTLVGLDRVLDRQRV